MGSNIRQIRPVWPPATTSGGARSSAPKCRAPRAARHQCTPLPAHSSPLATFGDQTRGFVVGEIFEIEPGARPRHIPLNQPTRDHDSPTDTVALDLSALHPVLHS